MDAVDVAIVGAGVMGAATAWALSKRGVDAVVLEQFEPGHDRGSSHGATRIFRFAYDDPFHVALAQRSLPFWRDLEAASGGTLLTMTGGLDFGTSEYLAESAAALHSCGAEADILSAEERRERFPQIDYGREQALYSPDTGVLAAGACVKALLDQTALPLRTGVRVESIESSHNGVIITAGGDTLTARSVVMAAGGWAGPLGQTAGIDLPLQVSREQIFYLAGGDQLPVVIDRGDIMRYFLPPAHGSPGAKAGEHGSGERTTADGRSFDIDPEGQARVADWIGREIATVDPHPVAAETCLYTLTPDEDFIIERHGPIVIVSACSGHGFKFAPMIGEVAAALAMGTTPPVDIGRYASTRFG